MIRRIAYYLDRMREAGPAAAAAKLWQKASPCAYWPSYTFPKQLSVEVSRQDALKEFGALCRQAFLNANAAEPGRSARPANRLAIAQDSHFPVLGYGKLEKPSGSGWHCDSLHGYKWSPSYFARCNFVAPDVRSDVKIPWELSRLQWLVWLAEATIEASEDEQESLKEQFLDTVRDWHSANRPGYGINWACGMEVAIRATNLAVAGGVFAHLLSDEDLEFTASILRSHQQYLQRFPEISDVPGNHYLADLMGEVVLHAALDGLKSEEFEDSLERFAKAADEQFEQDGCHIERATIYHRLAYDIVALPFALALRTGSCSARILGNVAARAGAFMAQIADSGGNLPVFGDQDSGFVLWFGEDAQQVDRRLCKAPDGAETRLYSVLAAIAQDPRFFPDVPRETGVRSGFAAVANANFHAILKTGPIGLKGRAPHDHDDALALWVSWKGRPLIIDPGCHSYTLDPALRRDSLLSSRHNAPVPVDRERHVPMEGSINATMRGAPTAVIASWDRTAARGKLDLFATLGIEQSRSIDIPDGQLLITDRWSCCKPEGMRVLWLFDPLWSFESITDEYEISPEGELIRLRSGCEVLELQIEATAGASLRAYQDRFNPDYGAFDDCWALEITTLPASTGRVLFKIGERP